MSLSGQPVSPHLVATLGPAHSQFLSPFRARGSCGCVVYQCAGGYPHANGRAGGAVGDLGNAHLRVFTRVESRDDAKCMGRVFQMTARRSAGPLVSCKMSCQSWGHLELLNTGTRAGCRRIDVCRRSGDLRRCVAPHPTMTEQRTQIPQAASRLAHASPCPAQPPPARVRRARAGYYYGAHTRRMRFFEISRVPHGRMLRSKPFTGMRSAGAAHLDPAAQVGE